MGSVKSGEGVTTFVVRRHCFVLSCCIPSPDFPSLYSRWKHLFIRLAILLNPAYADQARNVPAGI